VTESEAVSQLLVAQSYSTTKGMLSLVGWLPAGALHHSSRHWPPDRGSMTTQVLPTLWVACEMCQLLNDTFSPVSHLNGAALFALDIPIHNLPTYSVDETSCSTYSCSVGLVIVTKWPCQR
jgi:hypothetical protein